MLWRCQRRSTRALGRISKLPKAIISSVTTVRSITLERKRLDQARAIPVSAAIESVVGFVLHGVYRSGSYRCLHASTSDVLVVVGIVQAIRGVASAPDSARDDVPFAGIQFVLTLRIRSGSYRCLRAPTGNVLVVVGIVIAFRTQSPRTANNSESTLTLK